MRPSIGAHVEKTVDSTIKPELRNPYAGRLAIASTIMLYRMNRMTR